MPSNTATATPPAQCANPIYLQICKAWMDTARERNSKGYNTYKRAYESMRRNPLVFIHPVEAKSLEGWGEKLVKRLTDEYRMYCEDNGIPMPPIPRGKSRRRKRTVGEDQQNEQGDDDAAPPPPKRPRKQKEYLPGYRTGAYALLVALYEMEEEMGGSGGSRSAGVTKQQLVGRAQVYCDASFTAPSDPGKSYTAWAAMKGLVDKYDFVWQRGNPKKYSLAERGRAVAKGILEAERAGVAGSGQSVGEVRGERSKDVYGDADDRAVVGQGSGKGVGKEKDNAKGKGKENVVDHSRAAGISVEKRMKKGAVKSKGTLTSSDLEEIDIAITATTNTANTKTTMSSNRAIAKSASIAAAAKAKISKTTFSSPPPRPPLPIPTHLNSDLDHYDTTIELDNDVLELIDNPTLIPTRSFQPRQSYTRNSTSKSSANAIATAGGSKVDVSPNNTKYIDERNKENDIETQRRLRLEAIERRLSGMGGSARSATSTTTVVSIAPKRATAEKVEIVVDKNGFHDLSIEVSDDDKTDNDISVLSSPPPPRRLGPIPISNSIPPPKPPRRVALSSSSMSTPPVTFPTFTPTPFSPSTYTIYLVLDTREVRTSTDRTYLQRTLSSPPLNIPVLTRPLHLGDALWIAKHNTTGRELVLDWILERKRMDDLVGSIKDGRFHEQKFRLGRCGVRNVVYLVEEFGSYIPTGGGGDGGGGGATESWNGGADALQQSIQTALSSTQVINNFFVKRTQKLDDTIRYLARMTLFLTNLYSSPTAGRVIHPIPPNLIDSTTYTTHLLPHLSNTHPGKHFYPEYDVWNDMVDKSACMLLRDVFVRMLMCTRGVSAEKAVEIMRVWGTPRGFVEAFEREGAVGEGAGGDGEAIESVGKRREMIEEGMKRPGVFGRKMVKGKLAEKVGEVWGR